MIWTYGIIAVTLSLVVLTAVLGVREHRREHWRKILDDGRVSNEMIVLIVILVVVVLILLGVGVRVR